MPRCERSRRWKAGCLDPPLSMFRMEKTSERRRRWKSWCLDPPLSMFKMEETIAINLRRLHSSSDHDNEEGDVDIQQEILLRYLGADLSLMAGDLWPWRKQIVELARAIGPCVGFEVHDVARGYKDLV